MLAKKKKSPEFNVQIYPDKLITTHKQGEKNFKCKRKVQEGRDQIRTEMQSLMEVIEI